MIDPNTDYYYNILLSLILGVIVVLFIDQLFDSPSTVTVEKDG